MDYRIVTGRDTANLKDLQDEIVVPAWPEFMMHDGCVNKYWNELHRRYAEYQFVLREEGSQRVLAVGNSMPLVWDGDLEDLPDEGLDWALKSCFENLTHEKKHHTQCAFQIVVAPDLLGTGFSYEVVKLMMNIGRERGLDRLIAPVRPNMKSRYPLTPMESYIGWQREDGLPFDGWMRVHTRLGAETVKVCSKSMLIEGTVADWQKWTGMKFFESGQYIVPGALVPIEIDSEADKGTYIEPNVWMAHRL